MLEFPTFAVNSLLDAGHTETIEEVVTQSENKNLLEYLGSKYENENLRNFARKEEADECLYDFVHAYSINDFSRKFGVSKNGLSLVIAALVNS